MAGFLTDVRETLFPRPDSKDGFLPPILVLMTVITGIVDASSYLGLGHVFVANMTGNVVFVAFAIAGVSGFSILSSVIALVFFVLGALSSGRFASHFGVNRAQLLGVCLGVQALLVALAVIVAGLSGDRLVGDVTYALIAPLACSMGLQNGVARKLAVPDLSTTVLTLTIVGIGADSKIAGGAGSRAGRRLTSVASMFLGALIGALLVLHAAVVYSLILVFGIAVVLAAVSLRLAHGGAAWTRAQPAVEVPKKP